MFGVLVEASSFEASHHYCLHALLAWKVQCLCVCLDSVRLENFRDFYHFYFTHGMASLACVFKHHVLYRIIAVWVSCTG